MKKILITGANGVLGGTLVKELIDNSDYGIVAVSNSKEKIVDMLKREGISDTTRIFSMDQYEFFNMDFKDLNVSATVHMAFSRSNRSKEDIASSLDYTKNVFKRIHDMQIPRVIYISSQSVYGDTSKWRREDLEPAPSSIYSMAKYAGEKLLELQFSDVSETKYSAIRLDYVIQSQKLVQALCTSANEKGIISLQGGKQTFSYIDKSDAAKAVIALLNFNGDWKPVYNVGPCMMRYSLLKVAEIVKEIAARNGKPDVKIYLNRNDTELWAGMDSSLFMNDTGWKPSMDIFRMVDTIYKTL